MLLIRLVVLGSAVYVLFRALRQIPGLEQNVFYHSLQPLLPIIAGAVLGMIPGALPDAPLVFKAELGSFAGGSCGLLYSIATRYVKALEEKAKPEAS